MIAAYSSDYHELGYCSLEHLEVHEDSIEDTFGKGDRLSVCRGLLQEML